MHRQQEGETQTQGTRAIRHTCDTIQLRMRRVITRTNARNKNDKIKQGSFQTEHRIQCADMVNQKHQELINTLKTELRKNNLQESQTKTVFGSLFDNMQLKGFCAQNSRVIS